MGGEEFYGILPDDRCSETGIEEIIGCPGPTAARIAQFPSRL
jgi:hypothetical protein